MALKAIKIKRGKRNKMLTVYVNPEEQKTIEQRAANHQLTVSAFIRTVCLDPKFEPRHTVKRLRVLRKDSRQAQLL